MSVYVDDAIWEFRGMLMCHMIGDTEEELHQLAATIGLQRRWFQQKHVRHYDVSKGKRFQAIRHGAIALDRTAFVAKMNQLYPRS